MPPIARPVDCFRMPPWRTPVQSFIRNDIHGSTIGPISAGATGVRTPDTVCLPGMHSLENWLFSRRVGISVAFAALSLSRRGAEPVVTPVVRVSPAVFLVEIASSPNPSIIGGFCRCSLFMAKHRALPVLTTGTPHSRTMWAPSAPP
jgi:hypothetical protein